MQWRAGGHIFLLGIKLTLHIIPPRPGGHFLTVQTPETVVILIRVPLLLAVPEHPGLPEAKRGAPDSLLQLNLGALEYVDGVGRQGELQAVQVFVHHLLAVDELCTLDLKVGREPAETKTTWSRGR